jgi:hypothetical protein
MDTDADADADEAGDADEVTKGKEAVQSSPP